MTPCDVSWADATSAVFVASIAVLVSAIRDRDANYEAWLIYYGDVHVGTINLRSGNPTATDSWSWRCGFLPGFGTGRMHLGHGGELLGVPRRL
jgi:hypothetical protein